MANDKLKELTERLYKEGLSKGREEGDKILAEARARAGAIEDEARKKAAKTIADAEKKASDIMSKAASDVKMASAQSLQSLKAAITDAVLAKSVDSAAAKVLSNESFVKDIILKAAAGMGKEAGDLCVILPEDHQKKLGDYVRSEISKAVGKGIEVRPGKIKGGFNIGPKDGGYFISMSEETFDELIKEYLRPATRKELFGE